MDPLVEVRDLKKYYPVKKGVWARESATLRAVDGVSFEIQRGRTLGLVGESGCGKSTVARLILRLVEPTAGEVYFDKTSVFRANKDELRKLRRKMQIVFQDPYSSLNPRMTVRQIVEEPLRIHTKKSPAEREQQVAWLLEKVGLSPDQARRYPHEFSGGQRQRIGIARALATRPRIVIADEPISALDVSIQAQVINLMQDLQDEFGLTYLFIAHDLSVVRHISDRISVMYLGDMVETGPAEEIYSHPLHPYSRALLSAVPNPVPGQRRERTRLKGEIPSPIEKPGGCSFHPRCPIAHPSCASDVPVFEEHEDGRMVACPWV